LLRTGLRPVEAVKALFSASSDDDVRRRHRRQRACVTDPDLTPSWAKFAWDTLSRQLRRTGWRLASVNPWHSPTRCDPIYARYL
jgi:hypothetical protein